VDRIESPNRPPPHRKRILPIREVSKTAWLACLFDPKMRVEFGRVILGSAPPLWRTQPRSRFSFGTHYLFYSDRNQIECTTATQTFLAPPRTLLWFPPGFEYHLHNRSKKELKGFFRIRFRIVDQQTLLTPWQDAQCLRNATFFPPLVHQFDLEYRIPTDFSFQRIRGFLSVLSTDAFRCPSLDDQQEAGLTRAQIAKLVQYVSDNIKERLRPAHLAEQLELSSAYFARIFRKTFKCSPRRWLVEERVRLGAQKLHDTQSNVSEIAYELGYEDPQLFSRQFKQVMGCSPKGYRSAKYLPNHRKNQLPD